jgi:hypothetical protein
MTLIQQLSEASTQNLRNMCQLILELVGSSSKV